MRTRGDESWWTQGLLAAGLGVARRPVGRWLQQLEREGIVERRYASPGWARFLYGLRLCHPGTLHRGVGPHYVRSGGYTYTDIEAECEIAWL